MVKYNIKKSYVTADGVCSYIARTGFGTTPWAAARELWLEARLREAGVEERDVVPGATLVTGWTQEVDWVSWLQWWKLEK